MLELKRLRLLKELHERGTIAAVADALQFTPSAVSQQLALLERETGVRLLERSGRGVRLTDPARVLVEHAEALLERSARAEADLAAASNTIGGRVRIATFQSVALRIVLPAMQALAQTAPNLRCEFFEAEPEQALPALATGDVDIAIGDHWQHQPWRLPPGLERHELLRDPVQLVLPEHHPAARHRAVPLGELRDAVWTTGHAAMGWEEMTQRTCRLYGGFEPDIRHRTNDATVSLALVARGLAVTLLPDLVTGAGHPGVTLRPIADAPMDRAITAVTRAADASRPSVNAVLDQLQARSGQMTASASTTHSSPNDTSAA